MQIANLFKEFVYELIPCRLRDLRRLGRWLVQEQVSLIGLFLNIFVLLLYLGKYVVKRFYMYLLVFFCGYKLFDHAGFGHLWFLLSGFALIYLNLRNESRKRGELSPYSVFNENFQRIMGDLDADQIDEQLRRGG